MEPVLLTGWTIPYIFLGIPIFPIPKPWMCMAFGVVLERQPLPLRNKTNEVPKNWSAWLSSAEWWYNTTFRSTLNATPFQIVYGMKPRHLAWQNKIHTNISG